MSQLHILPCLDTAELAATHRRALDIPRHVANELGHSAVAVSKEGVFINRSRQRVDFSHVVESACAARTSVAPAASCYSIS